MGCSGSKTMGNAYDDAASLSSYSYVNFFKNHKSLTDASQLVIPMLKCSKECFKSLFDGCSGLVSGPAVLPATTLAEKCYRNMFLNCSSLENAPYIAAESRADGAFQRMFAGCSSLKLIKLNVTSYKAERKDFKADNEVSWTNGVPAGGEIWLNPAIKTSSGFEDIIPLHGKTGQWTLKKLPNGDDWSY